METGSHEAWAKNMAVMRGIVSDMKEIPELPSEVVQESNALEKVEYPAEGGMLTYMSGHEYPYRGFPFVEVVEKIDAMKKLSKGALSGFYHSLRSFNPILWITLIPSLWVFKSLIAASVYTFYRLIERSRIKRTHYSQAVRELYRAFNTPRHNEDEKTRELRLQLKDLVCMVLEFDNAYRFRMQDILEGLDKVSLKKNPAKEITRLLEVMMSRETTQEISDTWKLVRMFVSVYLRLDRKFLWMVADVLAEVDIEKIKLTAEDVHFCSKRKDYVFAHMNVSN